MKATGMTSQGPSGQTSNQELKDTVSYFGFNAVVQFVA